MKDCRVTDVREKLLSHNEDYIYYKTDHHWTSAVSYTHLGIDGQISFGEDAFYQKYEQKIKLLTDKFIPQKDEDEHLQAQKCKEMEQYADYRNYLSFSMFEQVTDEHGNCLLYTSRCV